METHILVVEDDAEIREGVAIYLKNQGYTVHGAANGAQGLELARQLPIHLAVVDVMMPVMDGITMVMKLRDEGCEFPVIMLSAKSEDIDKITGLNIGADDYVTKPFVPMELLARVHSHLRRYEKFLRATGAAAAPALRTYVIGGLELCGHRGADRGRHARKADAAGVQNSGAADEKPWARVLRRGDIRARLERTRRQHGYHHGAHPQHP